MNELELHDARVFNAIVVLAPVVACAAGVTFTAARVFGLFPDTNLPALIFFDVVCCGYIVVSFFLGRRGNATGGAIDEKTLERAKFVLVVLTLVQWNLISYLFPSRDFWGYAPLFILISAFFIDSKLVAAEIAGISVSIALSWFVMGDALLPARGDEFAENMVLRIIALALTFAVLYLIVRVSENFKLSVARKSTELSEKNEQLKALNQSIIAFTADIVEIRDQESGTHVRRLEDLTRKLALQVVSDCPRFGLTPEKAEVIASASVMHDVGKIYIPDSILGKPGALTAEEFEVMKTHCEVGARIVDSLPAELGSDYIECCHDICLCHHERIDGAGYPHGLKGSEVPLSAQLVSLVDCYDALISERPYKPAFPRDEALAMLDRGECGTFDDDILACFFACMHVPRILEGEILPA